MEMLYVLLLENDKYYVGKTTNVQFRFAQHVTGSGSAWTLKHKPIGIIELRKLKDNYDENNTTKDYMKRYGVDNVRGGSYCQVDLLKTTKLYLEQEFNSSKDACYTCGKTGHFSNTCSRKKEISCFRCGRTSHLISNCYATTHADGTYIYDSDDD